MTAKTNRQRLAAIAAASAIAAAGTQLYTAASPNDNTSDGALEDNYISVSELGADGRDDIDDFDAIQQALNAAFGQSGHTTVYVPEGNYLISSTLRIYSNTTLQLDDNARIIRMDESKYMLSNGADIDGSDTGYDRSHDITVEGGVWDGNVTNALTAKGLVKMWNIKNVTFANTEFSECCGTHFVLFNGADGITITNSVFSNFIRFAGTEREYIAQTKAKFNYRYCEALHLDFIPKESDPLGEGVACRNISVSGCRFENIPAGIGTHHNYDYMKADNVNIHDNFFIDCAFYAVDASSFSNIDMYGNTAENTGGLIYASNSDGRVYDNTLEANTFLTEPIYYHSKDTNYLNSAMFSKNCDIDFSGNALSGASGSGLCILDDSTADVYDNTISGTQKSGIIISECSGSTVYSNSISGCGENGILLRSGANIKEIKYNLINAVSGHGIAASRSNFTARHNDISDCAKHGVYVTSSTEGIVKDSRISGCKNGIYVSSSAAVTASGCEISGCAKNAFSIAGAKRAKLVDNSITECGGLDLSVSKKSKNVTFKNNGSDKCKTKVNKGSRAEISALKKTLAGQTFTASKSAVYTGSEITPAVKCKKLKEGKDYTVSFSDNIDIGKGVIRIKGKGSYRGTVLIYFDIIPPQPQLAVSPQSGAISAQLSCSVECTGYEISCWQNGAEDDADVLILPYSPEDPANDLTITPSEQGKLYYVKARAYADTPGGRIYGKWSAKRAVRV